MRVASAIVLLLAAHAAAFNAPSLTRTSSRVSSLRACADDQLDAAQLEAKLKDAVEREDYKAAAELKVQLNEAVLAAPVPVKSMYDSLQKRSSLLASRREAIVRERELVAELGAAWPKGKGGKGAVGALVW